VTRVALHMPGSRVLDRPGSDARMSPLATLARGNPRVGVAAAHLAALAVSILILALEDVALLLNGDVLIWLAICVAFSGLRIATARASLASSTVLLDALGMAVFLAGTGAPASPFYVLVLAGVWWAAQVSRPRSGFAYALTFATAYLLLVLPVAFRDQLIPGLFEGVVAILVVGTLVDWFIRVDRRAIALNDALYAAPFGAEQLAVREGLLRALRSMDVPVDVILTAGQVGLTALQAELLAYLMLGLSNFEIADAAGVSEATIRYRLTRLYRTLGVRGGRHDAARRAQELGATRAEQGSTRSS
jgi:DNA-binding CsgD family transcriptional regulator